MSDINSQLKKFERKVRFHEATNKYLVEIVKKGINWLEKRAKAIDDWQDQLVETHNASIRAIKDQESREVERLQNQIAETKLNTQDAMDSVTGVLVRATQSAEKARKGLNIARNEVSPALIAIQNSSAQ